MRIVLLGATKGIGRALARRFAARGDELFLLGRSPEDLAGAARDLEIRSDRAAGSTGWAVCDLEQTASFAPALDAAWSRLGRVDALVISAALFATQERLESRSLLNARGNRGPYGQLSAAVMRLPAW